MASTPPEADLQFNIGEAPDSLERMCDLNARSGDIYRLFVPSRRGYVYVINHPDDLRTRDPVYMHLERRGAA